MDETEVDPFGDIAESEPTEGFNVIPFDEKQRLIVQNFFDTNEAARTKYLKQLGYEVNPNDDNEIRPLGSKGMFIEIDPGFGTAYQKGGLKAVGKEILQDAGDVAWDVSDVGQRALAAIGSGLVGAAGGSVVPLAGTAVGGTLAAMAGAAASGALSNSAKQKIRDVFLDEDMPYDAKEAAVEAALSAAGAGIFKGAAKGLRKIKDFDLGIRIDGIKNALKAAGNISDPTLIERAAKNPEMFTEEAVAGGADRLRKGVKDIFGLGEDEMLRDAKDLKRIRPDSYFGKIITPMSQAKDTVENALSVDRNANVSYVDAKENLQKMFGKLETTILKGNATQADEEAYIIMKKQVKNLRNMAAGNLGIDPKVVTDKQLDQVQFNYGQARDFLEGLQDRAFNTTTKTRNPVLTTAAGGMRQYLDDVAVNSGNPVGAKLPELNKLMSGVIDDYNQARTVLNPQTIVQAYVGGGNTVGGTIKGLEIQDVMKNMDAKYGTELAKDFETDAAQAAFENVYRGAPAKGSSQINQYMVAETAKGIGKGAGLGGFAGSVIPGVGTGTGVVAGGLLGGARAAQQALTMANPEKAVGKLGSMMQEQAARSAMDPTELAIKDALAGGAGSAAGALVSPGVEGNQPEEVDPFADF